MCRRKAFGLLPPMTRLESGLVEVAGLLTICIFAAWPFEKEAIEDAVERFIEGHRIRVASLGYLLFLKFTSEREKNFDDAPRLVRRHRGQFDEVSLVANASVWRKTYTGKNACATWSTTIAEMVISELRQGAAIMRDLAGPAFLDNANGDARHAHSRRRCEQQLVIFARMQRILHTGSVDDGNRIQRG